MADAGKELFADDDWKEQAKREKERLAQQEAAASPGKLPEATLTDLLNLIALQALVGLGMMEGPQGERIPPNLEVAKHFIDLLGVLQQKTKNNLSPEEQHMLDQVTYDLRLRFVETLKAAGVAPPAAPGSAAAPA